jgi:hypothetical protein
LLGNRRIYVGDTKWEIISPQALPQETYPPHRCVIQLKLERLINTPPGTPSNYCTERGAEEPCWVSVSVSYPDCRLTLDSKKYFSRDLDEYIYAGCWSKTSIVFCLNANGIITPTQSQFTLAGDYVLCAKRGSEGNPEWIFAKIETIQRTDHYAVESMVDFSENCSLTAAHPVLKDGVWYRADELLSPTNRFVDCLYNYEIQGGHSVLIGEYLAVPLGVPIERLEKNNPVAQLWGTHYWDLTRPRLLEFNHMQFSFCNRLEVLCD